MFLEHFPDLRPGLMIAERKGDALKAFSSKLEREAHMGGMDRPPWTANEFLAAIVAMTEARALAGNLDSPFTSGSRCGGGQLVLLPSNLQIAEGLAPNVDGDVLARQFANWVTATQRWPEAAAIRHELDLLSQAAKGTAAKLRIIENLISVTSRCYLCRQHDGRLVGQIVPPDSLGTEALG